MPESSPLGWNDGEEGQRGWIVGGGKIRHFVAALMIVVAGSGGGGLSGGR